MSSLNSGNSCEPFGQPALQRKATVIAPTGRTVRADESEAHPGVRVWHVTLDPIGLTKVTVSWKVVADDVIEPKELREMMLLSETPEVFAGLVLERAEEMVLEPMPPYVLNRLARDIVQWCFDNKNAIRGLLERECYWM